MEYWGAVALETIRQHVKKLGGLRTLDGSRLQPFTTAQMDALAERIGALLPPALVWWLSTYGGGLVFSEPVVYDNPQSQVEVVLGHLLDRDEMLQVLEDFNGVFAPHRLPFHDDEIGNYLLVGSDGVYEHIHDSPDEAERRLAPSFEQFILMLRRGD